METLDLKVLDYENDDALNTNGFHYISTITATYDQLVEILVNQHTQMQTHMKRSMQNGLSRSKVVEKDEDPDDYFYKGFTIYNWKTGYIPTEEYEWHVGGQDYEE